MQFCPEIGTKGQKDVLHSTEDGNILSRTLISGNLAYSAGCLKAE
jgi:hypothetical protein